jgi:hypothetical protein
MGNLQELDVETAATSVGVAALVTTTLTCASQLRRTLDDFLDLAKADHAGLRLVRAPARLRPLLADVARQVLRAAHDKGLSVRVHVPRALQGRVFLLDAGRVAQVLSVRRSAPRRSHEQHACPSLLTALVLYCHSELRVEFGQVLAIGLHHAPRGR